MSYGGLRGAVAFALVLVVDEEVGTFCRYSLFLE